MLTWEMAGPDPSRRPVVSWQTVGGGHTVTVGRVGAAWYVEHRALAWAGRMCASERVAMVLADRARATVPGRTWIELRPIE